MKDNRIAVIVEGESYEGKVINSVRKTFFLEHDWKASYTVIALPAAQNIYMLWNRVKDDEFVDLIEIVRDSSEDAKNKLKGLSRDDFSELYLFFDYDSQQTNLPKDVIPEEVLEKMLETFNNETELGKLYFSYPMAEAIRDFQQGCCKTFSGNCFFQEVSKCYKQLSGDNNRLAQINHYTDNTWRDILNCYLARLSCLMNKQTITDIQEAKSFTPKDILATQTSSPNRVVLSAFPEFVIDYFESKKIEKFIADRKCQYPCEQQKNIIAHIV